MKTIDELNPQLDLTFERIVDEAACKQHASMGFKEGWGIALDQLVAHAKKM